jgi:hypothetical protein
LPKLLAPPFQRLHLLRERGDPVAEFHASHGALFQRGNPGGDAFSLRPRVVAGLAQARPIRPVARCLLPSGRGPVPEVLLLHPFVERLLAVAAEKFPGGHVQRLEERLVLARVQRLEARSLLQAKRLPERPVHRLFEDLASPVVRLATGQRLRLLRRHP